MPDIDLSTLTPRQQDAADSLVVMKEGAPDTMGLLSSLIQKERNQSGTAYTVALTDSGFVLVSTENANPVFTIALNATVAFSIGTEFSFLYGGTGKATIQIPAGGTINGKDAANLTLFKGQEVYFWKRGTNAWDAYFPVNKYGIPLVMAQGAFNP